MKDPVEDISAEGMVSIHLPCHFEYLRIARQSILDVCARAGLSEYKTAQLEMAVDEACTNIIEHSYGHVQNKHSRPDQLGMQINLISRPTCIVVELIDFGKGLTGEENKGIDPAQYMQDQRDRGLGLYIIKTFVDDIKYTRDAKKGNCLRLTKNM
jgi:serine/threonine-protein kinase RsbW